MENYLVINGKRVDLTEEQIKKLGLEIEKKSPFDRVDKYKEYWYINNRGYLEYYIDGRCHTDDGLFNTANYCTDKELMTARAKEEVLSRLLWRFSMENGGSEIDWENVAQYKYYIFHDKTNKNWAVNTRTYAKSIGDIYFIDREVAQRAMDEIAKPFYAGELEVCKIWEE